MTAAEICRRLGVSEATFYRWKRKSSQAEVLETNRVKELEGENARLRRLVAELAYAFGDQGRPLS